MFRVSRKKVSSGDLARSYIWHTFKTADRTLGDYTETLVQILLRNGLLQQDFAVLFEKDKLRNVYFTALLAIGVVDLRNSVPPRTAVLIGERLQPLLQFPSGIAARSTAGLVSEYLREVEAKAAEMPAHDAIALHMMGLIGLGQGEHAKRLSRNPLCVTALSRQLLAVGTGWWNAAVEDVRIAA